MPDIVATYDYRDTEGRLLYQNVRLKPKDFRIRRPDGSGGWLWGRNGQEPTLYRLPELLHAPLTDWVVLTEGEKDVETLRSLGFTAVTSGSAGSWQDRFAAYFRGRLVAIIGDADEPGRRYVQQVADCLAGVAGQVRIVQLPGEYKDISDFVEDHDSLGSDELRIRIQTMIDAAPPLAAPPTSDEDREPDPNRIVADIVCLRDVPPKETSWLWPNRYVSNAINILSGDPGTTKTFHACHVAATVTRGGQWPDGSGPAPAGSVLLVTSEDDPGILRQRLDAQGADPSRIFLVTGVREGKKTKGFDLGKHLDALEHAIDAIGGLKLVILDPITAYLGKVNANSNSEVRSTLDPLSALAARRQVTILGINHHNKRQDLSYLYRGLGSMGFIGAARSVWAIVREKDDPDIYIFAPVKSNYSVKPTGLRYRLIDGVVSYEAGAWTGQLDDALEQPRNNKGRVEACAAWLKDRLATGAVLSSTIFEEAPEQGFNRDLCYRAKEHLRLKASKTGFQGKWFWSLPEEETKDGI